MSDFQDGKSAQGALGVTDNFHLRTLYIVRVGTWSMFTLGQHTNIVSFTPGSDLLPLAVSMIRFSRFQKLPVGVDPLLVHVLSSFFNLFVICRLRPFPSSSDILSFSEFFAMPNMIEEGGTVFSDVALPLPCRV